MQRPVDFRRRGMIHAPLSVLVTGCSRFIGPHIVRHLCDAGHKVIGFDQVPPKDNPAA